MKRLLFTLLFGLSSGLFASENLAPPDSLKRAFSDLCEGNRQWPIWKVSAGTVHVDGHISPGEWEAAHPIYLSGDALWNRSAYPDSLRWRGYLDMMAVVRLLYDDEALYVSCQYFDDRHCEGNSDEPWFNTDALEFSLAPLDFSMDKVLELLKNPSSESHALVNNTEYYDDIPAEMVRVTRQFTAKTGLAGWLGGARYPGGLSAVGWSQREPEGSAHLGGISAAAAGFTVNNAVHSYAGAWAMELRIPLAALPQGSSGSSGVDGRRIKMGLTLFDDDTLLTPPYDKRLMSAGFERNLLWWKDYDLTGITDAWMAIPFYPTFEFAGVHNGEWPGMPDEFHLYGGKTVSFFNSLLSPDIAVERAARLFSQVDFGIFSNPSAGGILRLLKSPAAGRLSLFDVRGALVYTGVPERGEGFRLGPGLYFLHVRMPGGATAVKPLTVLP